MAWSDNRPVRAMCLGARLLLLRVRRSRRASVDPTRFGKALRNDRFCATPPVRPWTDLHPRPDLRSTRALRPIETIVVCSTMVRPRPLADLRDRSRYGRNAHRRRHSRKSGLAHVILRTHPPYSWILSRSIFFGALTPQIGLSPVRPYRAARPAKRSFRPFKSTPIASILAHAAAKGSEIG